MAVYLKKAKERPEQDLRAVSELVREVLDRVRLEGELETNPSGPTMSCPPCGRPDTRAASMWGNS